AITIIPAPRPRLGCGLAGETNTRSATAAGNAAVVSATTTSVKRADHIERNVLPWSGDHEGPRGSSVQVRRRSPYPPGRQCGPFDLGTAVGGNGPMLAGHLDVTMHLVPGTVVFADIVDGPTTRIASFHVSGPPVSTQPPAAVGTIVNKGFRFVLPAHFGRPG